MPRTGAGACEVPLKNALKHPIPIQVAARCLDIQTTMPIDPRTEPVSSMFEAAFKASEPLEKLSTWLLIGTAAVAALLIVNSGKLMPVFGIRGFGLCGAWLCISCLCGLVSKVFALRSQIGRETGKTVRGTFAAHLAKHEEEKRSSRGRHLQTGIRIDGVDPSLPWRISCPSARPADRSQAGHLALISGLVWQGYLAAGQAIAFLAFLVVGFACASVI